MPPAEFGSTRSHGRSSSAPAFAQVTVFFSCPASSVSRAEFPKPPLVERLEGVKVSVAQRLPHLRLRLLPQHLQRVAALRLGKRRIALDPRLLFIRGNAERRRHSVTLILTVKVALGGGKVQRATRKVVVTR